MFRILGGSKRRGLGYQYDCVEGEESQREVTLGEIQLCRAKGVTAINVREGNEFLLQCADTTCAP